MRFILRPFQLGVEINDAKMRLFSTGYDVPEAWLTVNPIGTIVEEGSADEPGIEHVSFASPEWDAVDGVLRSMWNAILKLQSQVVDSPIPISTNPLRALLYVMAGSRSNTKPVEWIPTTNRRAFKKSGGQ